MKLLFLACALMRFLTFALAGSGGRDLPTCKEDQLKCSGGIPSGAVFVCRKGRWEVLVVCGTGMSCITDPVPACTWAKAITGFEISGELVGADIEEKGTTAPSPLTDNLNNDTTKAEIAGDDPHSPYYNICSPCIRHNDNCKATQCDWQGKQCDLHCNQRTCSANLTTGDWRQPTISCGHFCKWPCH